MLLGVAPQAIRGGCTPGNSRLWVLVPSGDRPGPTEPAGETLASLVLINRLAHVRGGCTPGNSRLGAVSCAHACTNRWRTCAAGVISQANMPHGSAGQFAPLGPGPQWGPSRTDRAGRRDARFARAHRAVSARPRPSAWALNSRPGAASYACACANHQRTSTAECLRCQVAARDRAGQFAPMAARCRSCSSRD